jgi:hypothetical protein
LFVRVQPSAWPGFLHKERAGLFQSQAGSRAEGCWQR